jgi:hypothetical protein
MILPFSTQIKGKPTYFVEKILKGLYVEADLKNNLIFGCHVSKFITDYSLFINEQRKSIHDTVSCIKPKLHTIRDDANDRWHKDVMIDFYINCRQKNMFRFAPRIPCVSTQEVFMTYAFNGIIEISVDDTYINDRLAFAQNDGFDTWEDFFNYFYPKIKANPNLFYKGKIIHWTDLRY